MVRAKMSTGRQTKRIEAESALIVTDNGRVLGYDDRISGYSKLAEREAREILAETEPSGCEYGRLDPCFYGCHGFNSCPDETFRVVLAESLSAFVQS